MSWGLQRELLLRYWFVCFFLLSSCWIVSDSLRPYGLQHAKLPCPSPSPGMCPSSCPLNRWCYPTISSSVLHFSYLQSFPASRYFPVSQLFESGGKVLELQLQHQSFQRVFRVDFPQDWLFDLCHQITFSFHFQNLKSEISWVIASNMGNFCLRIRLNKHRPELEVNVQICKTEDEMVG